MINKSKSKYSNILFTITSIWHSTAPLAKVHLLSQIRLQQHQFHQTGWAYVIRPVAGKVIKSYNYYTHTRLTALFWDYPGEPVPEKQNQSRFYWSKKQWVAVVSAGPYAILHFAPDK